MDRDALIKTLLDAGVYTDADDDRVFAAHVADAVLALAKPDPHERMFNQARDGMLKYKGRREVYDFLLSLPDYYGAKRVSEKYGFDYSEADGA